MENSLRNEISISLAGETRIMRATFTAITAIERALGKSMTAIINQIAGGDLGVTEAAHIVFNGLRGNEDTRLSFEKVGEAIVQAGLGNVSVAVVEFVSMSLNGVSVGKPEEPQPAQ
jgi:hypothetical protein